MKFINPVAITDAMLISSTRAENDYTAWASGATYALAARVISTTTHRIYESVQAGNLNHNPTTDDGSWWIDVGPTNRWAMFDQTVGTVTAQATPLTVVLAPGAVTALALLDIEGADVTVTMTDTPGGTVVYSHTAALIEDDPPVVDWWTYYTSEFAQRASVILDGLPYYATCRLTVAITAVATARCGTLAAGRSVTIGKTLAKPKIGITDYSRKETDEWGVTSVVQRAYARRIDVDVLLDSVLVDSVALALAQVRATPVVWIGDNLGHYDSMMIYGWVRDWDIVIAGPVISEARLTIEGLT